MTPDKWAELKQWLISNDAANEPLADTTTVQRCMVFNKVLQAMADIERKS